MGWRRLGYYLHLMIFFFQVVILHLVKGCPGELHRSEGRDLRLFVCTSTFPVLPSPRFVSRRNIEVCSCEAISRNVSR